MSDTLIFVPIWNQATELPRVIREIRASSDGVTFLLVNNGSSDGSGALIEQSGLPFVRIPVNQGIGYSFRVAFEFAKERGFTLFGSMAGNGKMIATEAARLIEPLRSGRADYVTGSRFLPGGAYPNLPPFRRWAIPLVNAVAWMTTGQRLSDATNGFRVFRLEILTAANFDLEAKWLRTYGFEYYVYAKALLDPRIRCLEVPSTMRYPEEGSYSKIKPIRDWATMLRPWIQARFDGYGFGQLGWSYPENFPARN
ncbi:MAG: glycosyltransferase family 2 protein [Acidimicrobiia bacterium]